MWHNRWYSSTLANNRWESAAERSWINQQWFACLLALLRHSVRASYLTTHRSTYLSITPYSMYVLIISWEVGPNNARLGTEQGYQVIGSMDRVCSEWKRLGHVDVSSMNGCCSTFKYCKRLLCKVSCRSEVCPTRSKPCYLYKVVD
ncbi:hypothetical protein GGR51DRAFT_367781 [Nemania sp. FL0031]|nr:hypothetical protein GGR51DRAFT_367781 [Nemania sp. FL0031]